MVRLKNLRAVHDRPELRVETTRKESILAKRRQVDNVWVTDRDAALDGMFASMGEQAAQDLNRTDISIGTDTERLLVGLPLPALSLRYLFQSTILPLGRIIQITGQEGSCKSAFAYEILRWHFQNGGGGVMLENEGKDSPDLRHSILEWNLQWINRLEFMPTYTLEQWMAGLSKFLQIAAAFQRDPNGPGYTIPIAFIVDSIMSTLPEMILEKIKKEGHPTLGWPVAARLIADYMRAMPEWLQNFPFTIIGTNHLKVGQDQMGRTTYTSPGGSSVKFMETWEIQMAKMPQPDIDLLDYGGIRVKLKTAKNSLGPSRKQIVAELLWWTEADENDALRQSTRWDWYTASVDLLLAFNLDRSGFNVTGKKSIYKRLMEICHIVVTNKSRREAKCRALGITEPVSYRELGIELERHPEILAEMYPVLGITSRPEFTPGRDYQQMRQELAAASAAQGAAECVDVSSMPTLSPEALDPQGATAPSTPGVESPASPGAAHAALARAQAARAQGANHVVVDKEDAGSSGAD
jgi:RecA/RadA recombinase